MENSFEQLVWKVQSWGDEKQITNPENITQQFGKFVEEMFEFKRELDQVMIIEKTRDKTGNPSKLISKEVIKNQNLLLEMGDVLVTLIIMAKQLDIDLVECLEMAYDKIKNRKGKTIDGTFVKEEDLRI